MLKKLLLILSFSLIGIIPGVANEEKFNTTDMERLYPNSDVIKTINPVAAFEGKAEENLKDLQVPVPMKDRVFNKSVIQCVWCSLELLGNWAEEPKLKGMTTWPDCQSYSSPMGAARKLNQIKVKFEQTVNREKGRELIRKAVVQEHRGVLFGIPGHAMNLVHYDEQNKIVKYINNSDRTLAVRTWTMSEFERRWEGWVLVIYADNDIIPLKYMPLAHQIPILDQMGKGNFKSKDLILFPKP